MSIRVVKTLRPMLQPQPQIARAACMLTQAFSLTFVWEQHKEPAAHCG